MTMTEKNSASTDRSRTTAVWPSFQARDARALIDWLVKTLGFVENVTYMDGDSVAHAQLDWPGGGGLMLGDHKPGGEWEREPGTSGTYLVASDVETLYTKAKASGATITQDLTDQDYGSREFAVADPEGNLWSISTYAGEPRKA